MCPERDAIDGVTVGAVEGGAKRLLGEPDDISD
jgi:hypothetical protein